MKHAVSIATLILPLLLQAADPVFVLPTPNRSLFDHTEEGNQSFFAPTTSGIWQSGRYGCTRTSGWQFHEGIDILHTQRDRRGEPTDPIYAAADGIICYVNDNSGLSNYGRYLILGHKIEGIEIYTLYAHLNQIEPGVVLGRKVLAGATLGRMGRSSNAAGIAKYRAHLHFEIAMVINEHFDHWFAQRKPGQTNDHGPWNGRNLIGLDPEDIYKEQSKLGSQFSLLKYIQEQETYFTVLTTAGDFPWIKRYSALMQTSDTNTDQAYEISFNAYGLPTRYRCVELPAESPSQGWKLIQVNEAIHKAYKCSKKITGKPGAYRLTETATEWLDLLTYRMAP